MDAINRVLLDRIQRSFPLVCRPYHDLAEGLNIDGHEVRERVGALKREGLVRQISAIFNTGALGYQSSLVAMAVPEDHVERAAAAINRYPGVSHNYLRPGSYNIWYTVAVPPDQSLEKVVRKLSESAGGWPTLILPALRKYKLAVVLDVLEEGEGSSVEGPFDVPSVKASVPFHPTPDNIRIVRTIQEDLPSEERPFQVWGDELGITDRALLDLILAWKGQGIIRRFAAVLNHRQAGFSANGMVVWRCPEDCLDDYGRTLSSYPEVSHCYHRPAYPEWPYNLYAMIHGRTKEECHKIAHRLGEAIRFPKYQICFSEREFKKIRLKLFWKEPSQLQN